MSSCAVYEPLSSSYKYRICVHCAFVSQFRDPLFYSPSLENKSQPMLEWGKARDRSWRGSNYFYRRYFFLPDPSYFSPFFIPSSRCTLSCLLRVLVCKYFVLGFSHSCHKIWLFLSFRNVIAFVSSSILFVIVGFKNPFSVISVKFWEIAKVNGCVQSIIFN